MDERRVGTRASRGEAETARRKSAHPGRDYGINGCQAAGADHADSLHQRREPVGTRSGPESGAAGGIVTGFADVLADLGGKYVQFAIEMNKPPGIVYYVWYSGWTDAQYRFQVTERAAQSLGVKLQAHAITDLSELDGVMKLMKRAGAAVVIVQPLSRQDS
jgi:hypothetical protein